MKFELLEDKVDWTHLRIKDHVMINDQLWRVIDNFPVIGGSGRMLMLAHHTHLEPKGFKFHQVDTNSGRTEVFRKI